MATATRQHTSTAASLDGEPANAIKMQKLTGGDEISHMNKKATAENNSNVSGDSTTEGAVQNGGEGNTMTTREDGTSYPSGTKLWLAIFNLGALLILGGLDVNIVATAVPRQASHLYITDHFHTVADVGWYSAGFRLCSCAFQFIFGKMYKLFSVKSVFLASNGIFLIGSLLCALASSSEMFIAGRAITGIGFAGIISGFFVILSHVLPLRRRPFFCGLLGGLESLAILAAPIIGGVLTENVGWRWCFWINLPIGGATFLLTFFSLDDPKPSDTTQSLKQKIIELDIVSNVLLIPGLTSLFIAFSWAGTKYPWDDGRVIGPLVTFVVLGAAFIYNQHRRGDTAALPPRVFKNRNVIAAAIFTLCTNSSVNVLEYFLPTYYQVVLEYSPSKSGYMMMPIVIGAAIGMFLCGSGTSIVGYYTPFMLLSSVLMPIFAGLITTFGVGTSFARLILFSGASGFASAVGFNAPMSAIQTVLPIDDIPLGISIVLFAQNFGPAVFVAIAQVIFTNEFSRNIVQIVPGASPAVIDGNGLTDIINHAPSARHQEALKGAGKSLSETWYLAVGLTCATLAGSLLMEWRSVKQKKS